MSTKKKISRTSKSALEAYSKVLPGDHIHYVAPEMDMGIDDIDDIMIKAENKQERKRLKRARDSRREGKV